MTAQEGWRTLLNVVKTNQTHTILSNFTATQSTYTAGSYRKSVRFAVSFPIAQATALSHYLLVFILAHFEDFVNVLFFVYCTATADIYMG